MLIHVCILIHLNDHQNPNFSVVWVFWVHVSGDIAVELLPSERPLFASNILHINFLLCLEGRLHFGESQPSPSKWPPLPLLP